MDILRKMKVFDKGWLKPDFMQVIEDHRLALIFTGNYEGVPVTPQQRVKYKGNFYGLLSELEIEPIHFYPILRINGYLHPADYNGEQDHIRLPDIKSIEGLLVQHNSNKKTLI